MSRKGEKKDRESKRLMNKIRKKQREVERKIAGKEIRGSE